MCSKIEDSFGSGGAHSLVSGGIDSQFSTLLLLNRNLLVECFNCVLARNQTHRVSKLAAVLSCFKASTRLLRAQTVFTETVVRRSRCDASNRRVACVLCNEAVKTALSRQLAGLSLLKTASGHHVRKALLTQRISNSLRLMKSQAYFTSLDNATAVYLLALLRKHETKQAGAQFASSTGESFGLCYQCVAGRGVMVSASGCAVWWQDGSWASTRLVFRCG